MEDEMVLRSVNLWVSDDDALRQLAFDNRVTKSELIRAAIRSKLAQWQRENDAAILQRDIEAARKAESQT
jgi:Arc/MetJ-type ribon-helix-helix transcriptional regulator